MQASIGEMWRSDRVGIHRHCDGVFTLEWLDGLSIMGLCSFELITEFVWMEFPPKGFG